MLKTKAKRKRIIKTSTAISTEEAVVENDEEEKTITKKPHMSPKKEDKTPVKKAT